MKNLFIILSLFAVAFSIESCKNNRVEDNRWAGKEHSLIAEAIHSDRKILEPFFIVQTQEHFVFWQRENERQFSAFRLRGDSLLYEDAFLTIGRGPFEVNAGRVHYVPENNSLVVVGYNTYGKTFVIPLDDTSNLFSHDKWREYNAEHTGYTLDVVPIDTVSYLINTIDDENMFSMLDIRSQTFTELETGYPDDMVAPTFERANIYGGPAYKRPWHNQFVHSSSRGHYVVIYTYDDNKRIIDKKNIFNEPPEYYVNGEDVRTTDDCLFGLAIVGVSDSLIYLGDRNMTSADIRSGLAMEKNGYPAGYSKTIYVCDWEGNPIAKYGLDRAIAYSSVDKNDEYIYAFAFNEETYESDIVRFKLPMLKNTEPYRTPVAAR